MESKTENACRNTFLEQEDEILREVMPSPCHLWSNLVPTLGWAIAGGSFYQWHVWTQSWIESMCLLKQALMLLPCTHPLGAGELCRGWQFASLALHVGPSLCSLFKQNRKCEAPWECCYCALYFLVCLKGPHKEGWRWGGREADCPLLNVPSPQGGLHGGALLPFLQTLLFPQVLPLNKAGSVECIGSAPSEPRLLTV